MMKIDVNLLKWDSDFFKLKIGNILCQTTTEREDLLNVIHLNSDFNLIYIFCDPKSNLNNDIQNLGAILYDQKVTYYQKIKQSFRDPNIKSILNNELSDQIFSLALQSGEYSRFKRDIKLGNDKFQELYKIWITRSLNKEIAFETFAYIENDKVLGLITLGEKNNIGDIGLLGVDESSRGKSIGHKLVNHSFDYLLQLGYSECQVVTQNENKLACSFYEKNNFTVNSIVNIYHLWL